MTFVVKESETVNLKMSVETGKFKVRWVCVGPVFKKVRQKIFISTAVLTGKTCTKEVLFESDNPQKVCNRKWEFC